MKSDKKRIYRKIILTLGIIAILLNTITIIQCVLNHAWLDSLARLMFSIVFIDLLCNFYKIDKLRKIYIAENESLIANQESLMSSIERHKHSSMEYFIEYQKAFSALDKLCRWLNLTDSTEELKELLKNAIADYELINRLYCSRSKLQELKENIQLDQAPFTKEQCISESV